MTCFFPQIESVRRNCTQRTTVSNPFWVMAAMGDPTAYRVRGSLIALRRDQAARVLVDPLPHQST